MGFLMLFALILICTTSSLLKARIINYLIFGNSFMEEISSEESIIVLNFWNTSNARDINFALCQKYINYIKDKDPSVSFFMNFVVS